MNPRTLLVAVVALSLAAGTAFFVQGWLNRQRAELYASLPKAERAEPGPKVLVARSPLPAGTILSDEHFVWQSWPKDGIARSYIVQEGGNASAIALHGAVLRRPAGAGEPITEDRVVRPGERGFLAAVLMPGMRAVTVPVTATSGIAGFVFPGDRVDLILAHDFQTGEGQDRSITRASETLLTDVRVLAVDQKTVSKDGSALPAKTATLEVDPAQAEMIALSVKLGELSLSLRSLRREEGVVGASMEDQDRPARRGKTFTRDIDVSRLIPRGAPGSNETLVHVVRGSKVEELKLGGGVRR
ncbi:MAG: Flp pilus assembly protein CpaB [Rhodospirillaceae bacterium]